MKAALSLVTLSIIFGYMALIPGAILPRPYGLWISIPLIFVGFFSAIGISMRISEGRLRSLRDLVSSLREGRDMLISWSIYMMAMIVITGVIALVANAL